MDAPAERSTRTAGPHPHPAAREGSGEAATPAPVGREAARPRRRRPSRSRRHCPTRQGGPPSSASARDRWPGCGSWSRHAAAAGLDRARTADLVLAVDEVATNSLRHGGGRGTLRIWRDAGALVCEVRDAGRLEDPMAGRERPAAERDRGRGLWMVNQLCDLVQLRSFPEGAAVRVHLYLP
jgi:anti-sigma regulatory factor (Ser/Thr protein kinase)